MTEPQTCCNAAPSATHLHWDALASRVLDGQSLTADEAQSILEHVQLSVKAGALTLVGLDGHLLARVDTRTFAVTLA